jgi:hypothetical protein
MFGLHFLGEIVPLTLLFYVQVKRNIRRGTMSKLSSLRSSHDNEFDSNLSDEDNYNGNDFDEDETPNRQYEDDGRSAENNSNN